MRIVTVSSVRPAGSHTKQVNDEVDLVNLRLARQQRLVEEQLTKDAASSPHVHTRGLRLGLRW